MIGYDIEHFGRSYGKTRAAKLATRKILDEGGVVCWTTGTCQYCGGRASTLIRHEKVVGRWVQVKIIQCADNLGLVREPITRSNTACPIQRVIV